MFIICCANQFWTVSAFLAVIFFGREFFLEPVTTTPLLSSLSRWDVCSFLAEVFYVVENFGSIDWTFPACLQCYNHEELYPNIDLTDILSIRQRMHLYRYDKGQEPTLKQSPLK